MKISLSIRLAFITAVFAAMSMADVLPFQWSTSGTFSPGLPSNLTFTPAPMSPVSDTDASGSLLGIDLGHFSFGNISTSYTGTFTLTVTFTRPDGSDDPVDSITLTANANTNGINDELIIDFPTASSYSFHGTDGAGTFNFAVRDVNDFRTGEKKLDDVILLGDITNATDPSAVPEPASILLLLTVTGGLWLTAKRFKEQ